MAARGIKIKSQSHSRHWILDRANYYFIISIFFDIIFKIYGTRYIFYYILIVYLINHDQIKF